MTDSTSSFTDHEGSGPGDAMAGLLMLASQAAYVSDGPAARPATQDHEMATAAQSAVPRVTADAWQAPTAGALLLPVAGPPLQSPVCTPCTTPADANRPGGS